MYDIERRQAAFDAVREGRSPGVAALIRYGDGTPSSQDASRSRLARKDGKVGISLIGFGNHVLGQAPAEPSGDDARSRSAASRRPPARNAAALAEKLDATMITTTSMTSSSDPGTDGVLICSSQPEHYEHICKAIDAGKAMFVEKPMVTRLDHFGDILRRMEGHGILLTLGLNRRYSPMIQRLRDDDRRRDRLRRVH